MKNEIINIPFGEDQYYKATYPKTQIVLHHTVSNGTAYDVAAYWKSQADRVATAFIIDKAGEVYQLFDPRFYAGHVGDVDKEMLKHKLPIRSCSKASIGIELINMGALTRKDDVIYDAYGKKFLGEYIHYPEKFRGYEYFAKYTQDQIDALGTLLVYLSRTFDIPTDYNDDIWNVTKRALSGEKGIFSHTSFRSDKSDLHPQTEMITMLKSL
jgi:N-acetyl-anhydromuramyl-L-alanine amidase AmpD